MLLGCVIAIVPVLYASIRHARAEAEEERSAGENRAARPLLQVVCPPCGVALSGTDPDHLRKIIGDHAWHKHGVPTASHLLVGSPMPANW